MVKPKFDLRLCKRILSLNGKPNSKAEAIIQRKHLNNQEAQFEEAVQWCKTNGKKGYSALKTRMFPLIKDCGTIDRRLKGKKLNGKKEHIRILTVEEEKSIVEFAKNKK